MIKKAFRMKLYAGYEQEYTRRHQEIWPEMRQMLKEQGAQSYSIFFDAQTNDLYGYLEIEDEQRWDQVASTAINQKWWHYMADIMETNSDDSPRTIDLKHVFDL
ncbi:L-rhamnose mutarotase [Enterococcus sp. RIT-PI-f]|uniref:L-rhamnose mutarotase n=1 Tax=Enterococcus sp. RIT-PI-f TaxID=1690244 RepID=UPI0006B89807|nr:L-rhamnose mutarotase [Enterococcus sp. RIT-PI-f]KPG73781.1 L-rhamnose mutarotase [Enterococcus sp. RIT-PI-f]